MCTKNCFWEIRLQRVRKNGSRVKKVEDHRHKRPYKYIFYFAQRLPSVTCAQKSGKKNVLKNNILTAHLKPVPTRLVLKNINGKDLPIAYYQYKIKIQLHFNGLPTIMIIYDYGHVLINCRLVITHHPLFFFFFLYLSIYISKYQL